MTEAERDLLVLLARLLANPWFNLHLREREEIREALKRLDNEDEIEASLEAELQSIPRKS